jgi:hypothetical protein
MSGADATGADLDAFYRALVDSFNFLQVGMPGATGFVVGVTDVVPEARTFAADFTYFRHGVTS